MSKQYLVCSFDQETDSEIEVWVTNTLEEIKAYCKNLADAEVDYDDYYGPNLPSIKIFEITGKLKEFDMEITVEKNPTIAVELKEKKSK